MRDLQEESSKTQIRIAVKVASLTTMVVSAALQYAW